MSAATATVRILALALAPLLAGGLTHAQTRPLLALADSFNVATPQYVSQQTISVATYDAATKAVVWHLPDADTSIPDYKTSEYGGPAAPQRYARVNAMRVTYEIEIKNRPAGFQVQFFRFGANGDTVKQVATITGNVARLTVSPPASSVHWVRMTQDGAPVLRFYPRLADQLGAFVVPHLLLSIVYEPPGKKSRAEYAVTTTAGTSVSWAFTRSSGVIMDPVPADTFLTVGMKMLAASQVLKVLSDYSDEITLLFDTAVTSNTTTGHRFSITDSYWTVPDDGMGYPGRGDAFVLLRDVLYGYLVSQGRIIVAPLAYARASGIAASRLTQELPPDVAQQYLALNPHWNSAAMPGATPDNAGCRSPTRRPSLPCGSERMVLTGRAAARARPRYRQLASRECRMGTGNTLTFSREEYRIEADARAVTQTRLEKVSGLLASLTGSSGTTSTSVTYTSTLENYSSTTVQPSISLACDSTEGEYTVDMYFDNVFGTFLAFKGPPLDTLAVLAGTAQDAQGRPRPRQPVTLSVGGRHYRVDTDANGNFAFYSSVPRGGARLSVGSDSYAITLAGARKRLMLKGGVMSEQVVTPTSDAPAGAALPGAVRTPSTTQPLPKPASRPRRP